MLAKSLLHWPIDSNGASDPGGEPNVLAANYYNPLDAQASIPDDSDGFEAVGTSVTDCRFGSRGSLNDRRGDRGLKHALSILMMIGAAPMPSRKAILRPAWL
jgi:hypothetical protein